MSLLIIEDDAAFLEILRSELAPRAVRVAHTFKEAFAMIDESAPETILLDLTLPDSTPLQTIARIRELKTRAKDATVIVITGRPDHKDLRAAAAEQGAAIVLSKDNGFFAALSKTLIESDQKRRCASSAVIEKIEETVKAIVSPKAG